MWIFSLFPTRLENLERLVSQLVLVSTLKVVYAYEKRVVHDLQASQESYIVLHLLDEHMLLCRSELEVEVAPEPIEVLECRVWVLFEIFFLEFSPDRRALQVELSMYIFVWWKEVVHDDEVYLAAVRYLNAVKSIELR